MSDAGIARLTAELAGTAEEMTRYLRETADYERADRLWPAHYLVFATNPLSVAYGTCGPAMFLRSSSGLPDDVVGWMLKQPLSVETYPPGLYLGLAGIACAFQELGLTDEAEATMETLYRSPLLYEEPGVFLGAAGWGLVSLHFFVRTGSRVYLDQAVRAGEHLLRTAEYEGASCFWRCNTDENVHYGFGYGASGIALFLLYLHMLTGRADFRACAIGGLEFDLANRVENELGWQWRRFQGDAVLYPYLIHGSAGVGSTVIRFAHVLGVERYEAAARKIADDVLVKYAFLPSLFEGLAGIGEFMLDMFRFTGEERFRRNAFDIAESILWFKIDRPQGVAFPGRWLTRISNDYATGSAGIGLFFTRLLRPGRRLFVDLPE
ncbi:lanthionine synthetase C family protein [Streptosporangium sp. KLBMP 9127]|nr:lanthionine synthetase C family protein [Streptosporangium sp. KLBMP 9127]